MHVTIKAEGVHKKSLIALAGSRGLPMVARRRWRFLLVVVLALLVIVSACSSNCLPEPEGDRTPPDVRIVVEYQPPGGGAVERYEGDVADTSVTLRADRNSPVHIYYTTWDSSGVRQLVPGLTIHHTVGIGVERRHVEIGPIEASCPRFRLERSHEIHGTGERRGLILTAGAENWSGMRASAEPVTVRLD